MLDEPFGALDARVRKDLRRWLREIHEQTGQTTVFVTHDQDEALELADRVTILRDGRVEQIGTPEQVHEDPATPFVMGFIGDTSLLPVSSREGALWHEETRLPVPVPEGREVTDLYVRPWDLAFVGEAEPGALIGTVAAVRRSAGGRRATIKLVPSGQLVEAEIPPDAQLNLQDTVFLRVLRGKAFCGA